MTAVAEPAAVVADVRSRATASTGLWSTAFVYLFAAVYAALFLAAATTNYLFDFAPRFDLGDMVQAVWATSHGHFLRVSDPTGLEMSRLGFHVDPFLVLLAPLWWLWSSPIVLLAAQSLAVASGALPVYWLARKHLDNRGFAVVFAIAYLLYPSTQFNAFTPIGIHAVSFAIPLILYAVWFLDEDRLVLFGVFAALAATTKEEIAAAVAGLGIWYAVRRGCRAAGVTIFALGSTISLINFLIVIPHFSPAGSLPFAGRYEGVGGTPGGMLHVAVTDPTAFLHQMATGHKLFFLILIFGPFIGLWAREPLMLVGALPDLAINLLSSNDKQTTIFYQYTSGIIPFVVVASVLGAAKLRGRSQRHAPAALLGIACCLAIVSPLIYAGSVVNKRSGDRVRALRHAVHLIPAGAPTSASLSLGGNVSTRPIVVNFPMIGRATWAIVGPQTGLDSARAYKRRLAELRSSPRWKTVYSSDGVEVFHRIS
jgi:uncharacterized membrane protein